MKLGTSLVGCLLAGILATSTTVAAVLVTTGTTGDGKAFITVPTITFKINKTVSASGFNALAFDFRKVWSTTGTSRFAAGSGLTFSDSVHPGTFNVSRWDGHASPVNSHSNFDSILLAAPDPNYTYKAGDVITLQGGTFTVNTANPSFPVFPSGSYEVYFVGLGTNGGPLSSAGVSVPKPSTVAPVVVIGLVGLGVIALRRRRHFSSMKNPLIITGMALAAIVTSQAQEITVKPVGISVSTLRRNLTGQVINPLKDKANPQPFFINGAMLTPGTQVSMVVKLPEGSYALVGSNGPVTTGLKLKSLADSTGKDLLSPPEGSIAGGAFFAGNRDVLAMSEDQNTLFLVALGVRSPRPGATSVKGEFLMDVIRGKVLTEARPFSPSGKIAVENTPLLVWGKGNFSRPPGPTDQGFTPGSVGPQQSTKFSEISKGVVKIDILDAKDNVVTSIKGPDTATSYGLSWADKGTGPYKIVVSYIDPTTPISQVIVPFEVSLGVSAE